VSRKASVCKGLREKFLSACQVDKFWGKRYNLIMPKKNRKIKLAIFDIDGTIFRSSLMIEVINELVAAKIFPEKASKELKKDYEAWLNRAGGYDMYIKKIVAVHLKYIKGLSERQMDWAVQKVLKTKQDRVYRYSRDLLKQLRKKKYYLLALSHSPIYIVNPYSKFLGFNDFFGSIYVIKEGFYTGHLHNADYIMDKSLVLKKWLSEKNKTMKIDIKNSIAVGDTESDIPMMKMMGKPIAFNPNSALAKHARKHKWKIVVERKDVIYDVKNFDFIG
jgi:HAD superfamily hydrolase (TIGR01490 family)